MKTFGRDLQIEGMEEPCKNVSVEPGGMSFSGSVVLWNLSRQHLEAGDQGVEIGNDDNDFTSDSAGFPKDPVGLEGVLQHIDE